ncbi:MAG TPA: hypothetical protein VL961_10630 [Acidimicrobiales bacterium]|nr:hypothetical protein [Acidimicrobiales bacterium]
MEGTSDLTHGPDVTAAVAAGMRALLQRRRTELAAGGRPVGWKVGLDGPAVQRHFGLSGPVVGYLTSSTVLEPGVAVSVGGWRHPALEVEVAVSVGNDGGVAGLAAALELVDLEPVDGLSGVLGRNVFHRGVVFGPEVGDPGRVDPAAVAVRVVTAPSGEVAAEGALAQRPEVTLDVVRRFLVAHGARLEAGDRVIAGSMIAPLPVEGGQSFHVEFGVLGSIDISFV